jgi:RNA polymerase sigma-70 factor (ECF subfamily)
VLGDQALAEDAVQDAFVKVWQRCATFRGEAELGAWVRSIVRHTVLDHWRQRQPGEDWLDDQGGVRAEVEQAWSAQAGAPATPEQRLNEQQLADLLARCQAAFEAAAPLHAQVVRWVAVEGLTPAEVAGLLGRSPGATREFLSQARKKARLFYEPWHQAVHLARGVPASLGQGQEQGHAAAAIDTSTGTSTGTHPTTPPDGHHHAPAHSTAG